MRTLLIAILCCWFTSPLVAETSEAPWESMGEKGHVKIFRRIEADSTVLSVKGSGKIDAPVADVFAVLKANEFAHVWMPLVDKRFTIRDEGASARVDVTFIGMPWPLSDRYVVTLSEATHMDKGWIIESHSLKDDYEDKNKVKAWMYRSYITIKDVTAEDGLPTTEIEVELHSDPKGSVPIWLVNRFQEQWPYEFIDGLRWFLQKKAVPLGVVPKKG